MSEILHTIDFVTVTYNHPEETVQEMIDSIKNIMQYCPHFEYKIILQDNSEEHKLNAVKNCDHIRFSSKNLGYCGGNNEAIKNSKSDHIIIINPDIKITNSLCIDWLIGTSKLYNAISGTLVGTNNWYTYSSSFPTDKKYDPEELPFYYNEPTLTKPGNWKPFKYIDGCLMCFSRKLWEDVGGFDDSIFPGYFGENTFVFQAFLKGYSIHDATIKGYFDHIKLDNPQSQNKIKIWSQLGRKKFYEKYALNHWDKFIEYLG